MNTRQQRRRILRLYYDDSQPRDEDGKWSSVGSGGLGDVKPKDAEIPAKDLMAWVGVPGLSDDEKADFFRHGFSPEMADEWAISGRPAAEARQWHDAGMSADEYRELAAGSESWDAVPLDMAKSLKDAFSGIEYEDGNDNSEGTIGLILEANQRGIAPDTIKEKVASMPQGRKTFDGIMAWMEKGRGKP